MSGEMSRNILPGENDWYLDGADIIMATRVAVDADTCVFAGIPIGYHYDFDDPSAKSRFYKYRSGSWVCTEVPNRITAMILYQAPGWASEGLVILCEDGELIFLGDELSTSRVDVPGRHVFEKLHIFEGKFYASAYGGKLFRRDATSWVHDDAGMLGVEVRVPKPPVDRPSKIAVHDFMIGDESYACGSAYVGRSALMWRPSGRGAAWRNIDIGGVNGAEGALAGLYMQDFDTIWVACESGYLLRGNGRAGFKIVTDTHVAENGHRNRFSNIVEYRGELYAGGTEACRVGTNGRFEPLRGPPVAAIRYQTTPEPEPKVYSSAIRGYLDTAGGFLWAIDWGMLSRFDGTRWTRIPMPSVYHNG